MNKQRWVLKNQQKGNTSNLGVNDVYKLVDESEVLVDASETQRGLINNTPLQELGGVDKKINSIRIGRGPSNFGTNLVISRNGFSNNTTGQYNVAIGDGDGNLEGALQKNTTGEGNLAIGSGTLTENTTGQYNVAMGVYSLYKNTTGSINIGIGAESLTENTTGEYNLAVGLGSLKQNTTGESNLGIGHFNLTENTTGQYNISVGHTTLSKNTTGTLNTAIGYNSLKDNVVGGHNVAIGSHTLRKNTGYKNTVVGTWAAQNVIGNYNVHLGFFTNAPLTLNADYAGNKNIIIGALAGQGVSGNNNVFLGCLAGRNSVQGELTNNKLVIHSSIHFVGGANTEGTTIDDSGVNFGLIVGDFAERWVKFNGKFTINPTHMRVADNTFTKNVVANSLGEFGWEDKINPPPNDGNFYAMKDGVWVNITDKLNP